LASLQTRVGALVILFGLALTRVNTLSALVALIIPTLVVILTGAEVTRVEDLGHVTQIG
jgi:SulP family sulfate permease